MTFTASPLNQAARVATAIWLAVSSINFVVWLIVSMAQGDLDTPWFLYAFVAGGVVVVAVRVAWRSQNRQESSKLTRRSESS